MSRAYWVEKEHPRGSGEVYSNTPSLQWEKKDSRCVGQGTWECLHGFTSLLPTHAAVKTNKTKTAVPDKDKNINRQDGAEIELHPLYTP